MAGPGDPTLLNLDQITAGQLQMYVTANVQVNQLEKATNDLLAVTLSGDVTLSSTQFTRAFTFVCSGNSSAHTLTVLASKRIFAVENNGSADMTVALGSTSLTLAAGSSGIFKTDGTTNGLKFLVNTNSTLADGSVTLAKLANLAADSVIGNTSGSAAVPAAISFSALATAMGVELTANKGVNSGYASLDSSGKVPTAQLPSSLVGGVEYVSGWNASTNSPTLASGTGTKGNYYVVTTAGTTNLDGISAWGVGDWAVYSGTAWEKIDNNNAVTSVAGKVGAVTLAVADVTGAAPLASPTFTGVPAGPTASSGTNTTQLATTAFVLAAVGASTSLRYDVATFYPGVPGSSQLILRYQAARAITIPAGATNSQASAGAAATGSATFNINKNGTNVGSVAWSASGTTGTFSLLSPISLAAGDVLTIVGPFTPDASLGDISITMAGTT
jgi:hypothetical protein